MNYILAGIMVLTILLPLIFALASFLYILFHD